MAGVAAIPLTDHEIDLLLSWYDTVPVIRDEDDALATRLEDYQNRLACVSGQCSPTT